MADEARVPPMPAGTNRMSIYPFGAGKDVPRAVDPEAVAPEVGMTIGPETRVTVDGTREITNVNEIPTR